MAAPKARPSGRVTSLAMVALPSVAGSSLVNPQVVSASMKAVAELLSCCVLGFVAAKRGILSPANVGALSKVKPSRKKIRSVSPIPVGSAVLGACHRHGFDHGAWAFGEYVGWPCLFFRIASNSEPYREGALAEDLARVFFSVLIFP